MKTAQIWVSVIVPVVILVTGVSAYIYINNAKKADIVFQKNCRDLTAAGFYHERKVRSNRGDDYKQCFGEMNFKDGTIRVTRIQGGDCIYNSDLVLIKRVPEPPRNPTHGDYWINRKYIQGFFKETDADEGDYYKITLDGRRSNRINASVDGR
jgi:hypothetical protein